jgi:predicted sugar kinase
MFRYRFIDIRTPLACGARVAPDPVDAERLEDKFQQARRRLEQFQQRGRIRAADTPRDWIGFGSATRWTSEV